jgi:hypothetical protein
MSEQIQSKNNSSKIKEKEKNESRYALLLTYIHLKNRITEIENNHSTIRQVAQPEQMINSLSI